jgi:hypothetical protein
MEPWWNDVDLGTLKNSVRNLSQCHFVTTNPTWTDMDVNLGLGGERLVTNSLSHGMA